MDVRLRMRDLVCGLMLALWGCGDMLSAPETAWEPTTTKIQRGTTASAGDTCAPGCIWSSYAVSMGAQDATANCQGQSCACVADGDVWTACELNPAANRRTAHTGTEQPRSQNATAGALCGSGCIWSTFAVSIGAQSSEASCDGAECACVVDGDVWTACGDTNDQSSNHDEQADQFAQDNPYQEDPYQNDPYQESGKADDANGEEARRATPGYSNDLYNGAFGNQLADVAYEIGNRRRTTGRCFGAVADAIESITGPFLYGSSAYMAADQLQNSRWFFEVSVSDLRQLPAGAVVVWSRGSSAHGHISVALGDGREASDHVTTQIQWHYGGGTARVFYPR